MSPNVVHQPGSSLETGRATNTNFYLEDELKFHGGGIGTGFDGRGSLSANLVDFYVTSAQLAEASAGACTPSSLGDPRF